MTAMEQDVVRQRAAVLLLSLLCFVSLLNKRLGDPGNTKVCGFYCCVSVRILIANRYQLMPFQNCELRKLLYTILLYHPLEWLHDL